MNKQLGFILIIALILRLISLNQSLWLDEAINILAVKNNNLLDIIFKYSIADFHPPGYSIILWFWTRIFGFSEISARLLSVVFGLLTILMTFLIGKQLFSKTVGLIAALLLALAPLHIYYSQEARMYSFAAFAVTLSVFFLLNLLEGKRWGGIGFAISIIFVLYSDYLAYFIIPVQLLYVYLYHKNYLSKFITALVVGILSLVFWIPTFVLQLQQGIQTSESLTGWKQVVGGFGFKEILLLPIKTLIGRISFDNKLTYMVYVVLISLPYLIVLKKSLEKISSKNSLLLFWLLTPPLIAFMLSFFIPVFAYFRFIFILPAFYLLLAFGIERLNKQVAFITVFLITLFCVFSNIMYLGDSKFHREDWKQAVNFVNENTGKRTLVLHKNEVVTAPFQYYQGYQAKSLPAFKNIPVKAKEDFNNLQENLKDFDTIYLFDYLVDITDSQRLLEQKLEQLGFSKKQEYDFRGVGFIFLYQVNHQ